MFDIILMIDIFIIVQLCCPVFNFTHPQFPIFNINEVSDGRGTVGKLGIKKKKKRISNVPQPMQNQIIISSFDKYFLLKNICAKNCHVLI